jgi:hypothetical protein
MTPTKLPLPASSKFTPSPMYQTLAAVSWGLSIGTSGTKGRDTGMMTMGYPSGDGSRSLPMGRFAPTLGAWSNDRYVGADALGRVGIQVMPACNGGLLRFRYSRTQTYALVPILENRHFRLGLT